MHTERLQRLIHILETAHETKQVDFFDLTCWYVPYHEADPKIPSENLFTGHTCGTAACALGLACMDPEFKAQGLKMILGPQYFHHQSYLAGAAFFDIDYEDSKYLFRTNAYPDPYLVTPTMVADRVKELIALNT